MKNLQNILLENMRRLGVKNLTKTDIRRLTLLEQETKEKSLTKRINFPSGMHSAQRGNVAGILGPQLKEMQDFLVANKGAVVEIILSSSESLVTNYDGEAPDPKKAPLKPGQLSQMRYNTIETYMTQWLQGLLQQGIITKMPEIKQVPSQFGTTPYKPGVDNPRDPKYTAEQWLQVTLKVVSTKQDIIPPTPEVVNAFSYTTRNSQSTWNTYNAQALFYFKSFAPAAVLNANPDSLPGALLTMNQQFRLMRAIDLPTFKLSAVTINIVPDGGQDVPVFILNKGVSATDANAINSELSSDADTWPAQVYNAKVSNSYSLIPNNIQPGSQEFINAWIFAFWYMNYSAGARPEDWNYISNKPSDINFEFLRKYLAGTGENEKIKVSPEKQIEWWKKLPINWYKGKLAKLQTL